MGDDDGFCEIAHGIRGFATRGITTGFVVHTGRVPNALAVTGDAFDALWDVHLPHEPVIELQQKRLSAPRRYQAYGHAKVATRPDAVPPANAGSRRPRMPSDGHA